VIGGKAEGRKRVSLGSGLRGPEGLLRQACVPVLICVFCRPNSPTPHPEKNADMFPNRNYGVGQEGHQGLPQLPKRKISLSWESQLFENNVKTKILHFLPSNLQRSYFCSLFLSACPSIYPPVCLSVCLSDVPLGRWSNRQAPGIGAASAPWSAPGAWSLGTTHTPATALGTGTRGLPNSQTLL
jgi:hypothetical protein